MKKGILTQVQNDEWKYAMSSEDMENNDDKNSCELYKIYLPVNDAQAV